MKTENLSIVFVDIAGFTARTSRQTREENEHMLRRFEDVVKPVVRVYKGKVVKNIGDAYLLTFRSPTNALLCSTAIHDSLAESNTKVSEDKRFDIRAAVNVGEVRVEGGDIFGEAVNIAARIEGQTSAGEVYFSEAVYLAMTRSEIPAEEVGYVELKGIPDKVRLYRIPQAGQTGVYSLASPDKNTQDGQDATQHPLVQPLLPFGGLGLNAVRERLHRTTDPGQILIPKIRQAKGWLGKIPNWAGAAGRAMGNGLGRWKIEVRRSRRWQIATAVVVVVFVAVLIWGLWPKEPKPLTTWQQIQRNLGI
jgi:class 3 adenylate cyclase